MNCTAWNSVRGERADKQTERHAENCIGDRERRRPLRQALRIESEEPERDPGEIAPELAAIDSECDAVTEQQIELVQRRRHQSLERPVVRSRSIVIDVTRTS